MFKPEIDPHAWPVEARETITTNLLHRVPNPEPQHVVVAHFDPSAPAMTVTPDGPRRPGIPVPKMDPIVRSHVDAIATSSWDRP